MEKITVNGKTYNAKKLNVVATAYCGSQKTSTGGWAKVKHTIPKLAIVFPKNNLNNLLINYILSS